MVQESGFQPGSPDTRLPYLVRGLGFRFGVQGLGFRNQGLGLRVWGLEFGVQGLGLGV